MKIVILGIGIVIIGALFVMQDFGSQIISDPSEPEQPSLSQKTAIVEKEPEPAPVIKVAEKEPDNMEMVQQQDTNLQETYPTQACYGIAGCITGHVTRVIDGDTIEVDGTSIRLVLVDTPEYGKYGFTEAGNYIRKLCPVGSPVLIDVDDLQKKDVYGRVLGIVYCDSWNLNEEILESGWAEVFERYCSESEFGGDSWVKRFGCDSTQYTETEVQRTAKEKCDSSYPDFCIPPSPPDLDCKDITQKRFTVLQPDSHRFDGDKDGIGCES